jgi:putative FmdB family regulatory protein
MPYYVFVCRGCDKEFTQVLHIADLDKGGIQCPHCGSTQVEQQVSGFSAVTSKKS